MGKLKRAYLYAIWMDGESIYIGKTVRDIDCRIKEHMREHILKSEAQYVYIVMREGNSFYFNYQDLSGVVNDYELETMEKQLIEKYKPRGNVDGVQRKYNYSIRGDKALKEKINEMSVKGKRGEEKKENAWSALEEYIDGIKVDDSWIENGEKENMMEYVEEIKAAKKNQGGLV